jgi:asparagine synthase (glutamine-hydrolysing)
MSGIYGFTGSPRSAAVTAAAAMARAVTVSDNAVTSSVSGQWVDMGAAGSLAQASAFSDGATTAAVFCTHRCGLPKLPSANTAEALARAYQRDGKSVIAKLAGGFALALADHRDQSVLLAIDRMGICSLAWTVHAGQLIFGSRLDAILAHPGVRPDIEPQALYDYLFFHVIPGPRTIYRGLARILPGHVLRFRSPDCEVTRYFTPVFDESSTRPTADLAVEFRDLVRQAVDRARSAQETGAFLSGGTDSSTVAGMLSGASGHRARAFSIGFAADGYDEMSYARIAARHFGLEHHEYYVTPSDVADAIPLVARTFDQPFGNASALPAYFCAKLAREHGIVRLLAGDGGDELFGGNVRYATQHIFSLYARIPAALRRQLIEPIVAHVEIGRRLPPLRKMYRYVDQARMPMPERLEEYNILQRLGPDSVMCPDLLQEVDRDAPLALLRGIYSETLPYSLINRMLALDFRITLSDSDLPKVNGACDLAGVEVAYPLLDDDLVRFSLGLDPDLKLRGTRLRYFFKEALREFLPREILAKRKHGFGLPFGVWLKSDRRLKELVSDSLSDLRGRRIVRPEFLSGLLDSRLDDHAPYYGTMVWILVMLEQWYRMRQESASAPAPAAVV